MNWFESSIISLDDGRDQGCDAGHPNHETTVVKYSVSNLNGDMTIFHPEKYSNTPGYCPGDDCVSRTIALYQIWEPTETEMFITALNNSPGIVIDFGTQIGWYSMLATKMGRDVLGIEGVSEHIKVTQSNASKGPGHLWQAHHWVCETTSTLDATSCPPVALVKIDLEGSEQHALRCVKDILEAGLIENILMEVSPVFNDTYPSLVSNLLYMGYSAVVCNPRQPVTIRNFQTVISQHPQVDMLFTKVRR